MHGIESICLLFTYAIQPQTRTNRYPQCLACLDLLLEEPHFRKELATELFRDWIHQQQFHHWRYRLRNHMADTVKYSNEGQQLEGKRINTDTTHHDVARDVVVDTYTD